MTRAGYVLCAGVTREEPPSMREPNLSVPRNVTEGIARRNRCWFSLSRFDSQWLLVPFNVSLAKQGREVMNEYSYAVAVTYACESSKVAETSAVVARCLPRSAPSRLRVQQALTADAKLPWCRLIEMEFGY
jgi:hypothetical protein